ncbi:DUF397 domain-containing protein [Streptomyces sp. NPDC006798]|uniref:DUF397 domain-containing protein n=1 Tax=Streptomyces sp. NPDC006798 TaxID=3155462 RepID=UPI0033D52517
MTASPDTLAWIKSSYSSNGGACVEWAPEHTATTGVVPVRDSKNPTGPALAIAAPAFAAFVNGVKTDGLRGV